MSRPDRALPACVILNPQSGGGAGERLRHWIERELARRHLDFELRMTARPGHAVQLAESAALAGADVVIAVGGDGTVHETANGILRARERDTHVSAALAVVPIGTGNDFAKVLGVTASRTVALDTAAAGPIHAMDAGFAEWEGGAAWFVNAMGTGIDVEVVRQIARTRVLPGALTYLLALARALRHYRPIPVRLRADGHTIETPVMTVAVANGRCVGGAFRICPEARPDDGLFDVCIVRAIPLLESLNVASRILRGTHTRLAPVELIRAEEVELEVPGTTPLFFQLDGELHEPAAHVVRMALRKGVLPVRVAGAA